MWVKVTTITLFSQFDDEFNHMEIETYSNTVDQVSGYFKDKHKSTWKAFQCIYAQLLNKVAKVFENE